MKNYEESEFRETMKNFKSSMGLGYRELSEFFGVGESAIKKWAAGDTAPPRQKRNAFTLSMRFILARKAWLDMLKYQ